MSDSFVNNKGRLEERVNLFNRMALPGQPLGMHMGTSYLVNDLMREVKRLREVLAECEEYFDDRADADQPAGADYPTPNDEMRLLTAIRGVK